MSYWVALHCTQETAALQREHPNAFLLLALIARRARWTACPITGLQIGQAFIGDFKEAGLKSRQIYRTAIATLAECELATFKATNKGTIATLASSSVFTVSSDPGNQQKNHQTTIKQPSSNHQTTTNSQRHRDHKDHKGTASPSSSRKARGTIEEFRAYAEQLELPGSDGEHLFEHLTETGWMRGKSPVKDWRATMRKWKNGGWLPSQKDRKGQPQTPDLPCL